jgi:hypothetical protein
VRLEAQEKTVVPEVVCLAVLRSCFTNRIDPMKDPDMLTQEFMKGTLKHAGYSKFYENIMQIRVRLTGIPARQFSAEEKDTLMKIFRELQEPFEKHRKQRKNFLSYSYVMHKICQLLGITGVLKYLLLPTLPDNKIATDNIWEKMCAEVGYEYVPTL